MMLDTSLNDISLFFIILKKIKDGRKFWSTPLGQVGGLQLKDAQPLEGKLKEFMDSATGGTTLHFDVMLIFSNTQQYGDRNVDGLYFRGSCPCFFWLGSQARADAR